MLIEEEINQIEDVLQKLRQDSKSNAIFLFDKSGQPLADEGDTGSFSSVSLPYLTAGKVTEEDGLPTLLAVRELIVEVDRIFAHISVVGNCAILLVLFDEKTSLGLVKQSVKKAKGELDKVLDLIKAKASQFPSENLFSDITDEEIVALFEE